MSGMFSYNPQFAWYRSGLSRVRSHGLPDEGLGFLVIGAILVCPMKAMDVQQVTVLPVHARGVKQGATNHLTDVGHIQYS